MRCCPELLQGGLAALALLVGCRPATAPQDTGPPSASADDPLAFDPGLLQPAFQHGNATWAGVALLDFDGDGWTDVFFTNGLRQPDALYRNDGDGSFTDVAAQAGVDSADRSSAVVAGDIDNDGDTDLVVSQECSTGSYQSDGEPLLDGDLRVLLNRGDGTFESRELVFDQELATTEDPRRRCTVSMTLGDLDSDGVLDLVLVNGNDPDVAPPWAFGKYHPGAAAQVLYGDGMGGFPEISQDLGEVSGFSAVVADLDGDGPVELIIGQAGAEPALYRQTSDGALQHDEQAMPVGAGLWMGLAAADYDGDGTLDLYGTNQGLSPLLLGYDNLAERWPGWVQPVPDFGAPDQVEVPLVSGGVVPSHAVLRGVEGGFRIARDWPLEAPQLLAGDLFEGLGGDYEELVDPWGLARQAWGWAAVALDADADGWPDVAWTGNNCTAPMCIVWDEAHAAGPGGLLHNRQGQGFEDRTWQAGVANLDGEGRYQDGRGLAVGDLDGDGYPDLVVANRTYNPSQTDGLAQEPGLPHVWLSRPREGHWLQVRLVGTVSSRDPLGATLWIDDGNRVQRVPYGAGGSTNSSSEILAIVGLGAATRVDIEVLFPSGLRQRVEGVQADQRIEIVEESP